MPGNGQGDRVMSPQGEGTKLLVCIECCTPTAGCIDLDDVGHRIALCDACWEAWVIHHADAPYIHDMVDDEEEETG